MTAVYGSDIRLPQPELLAPAGDWDCLLAAVDNGADAVYLGTREFNARVNARNFSFEELGKAVAHGHKHGVRIYLTMNTLVKNHEIKRFFTTLAGAYSLGIDGVIIQHISFLEIIKENFPGLNVFMSTQAAIGNVAAASLVKPADRIILPRELSLDEIKKITDSGVHTEIFVHGALCFSYSGLCLLSSFVSGRSGNRGSCAQICRQKFNNSYPLSTRELCVIDRLPEIIEAGVTGFKIEGRMRSPLYVAVATRLYRRAIDSYLAGNFTVPQKEMSEIEVVFNREFTCGFAFGDKKLIAAEKPANRGALLGVLENGEIVIQRPVTVGDGVGIWGKESVTGAVIQKIILNGKQVGSASAGDRVDLGLNARDNLKVYLTSSAKIGLNPEFTIEKPPIALQQRDRVTVSLPEVSIKKTTKLKILAKAYSMTEAKEIAQAGADTVFYSIFAPDFPRNTEWPERASLGAYLPRIMTDEEIASAVDLLKDKKPAAILVGNLGYLRHKGEFKVPVYLDYALNVFDDLDISFFRELWATPILSPELSLNEMMEFRNKDAVIFCHGDIVLVNTMFPLKGRDLIDEKGLHFPVRSEVSYRQILNSKSFGMFNDVRQLYAAGFSQFFIDKQGRGAHFVGLYRTIFKEAIDDRRLRKGHTSGHLYRPGVNDMPEIVTDSWEHNAEHWIKIIRERLDPLREHVTDKAMLDTIGICSGKKILDAGCGEGYLSRAMAGLGAIVTGVDRSKNLIAAAKEHKQQKPPGVNYMVGDFRETGLSDGSFDLIVCNHSIYEVPDPSVAFREFSRLLAPQGRLIMLILHPCFYDLRTQETVHTDFNSYFTGRRMSKHLEIGGVRLTEAVTIYLHPLEYYANALKAAGFLIGDIKEPRPSQEQCDNNPQLRRDFNIPIFLLIEAIKR